MYNSVLKFNTIVRLVQNLIVSSWCPGYFSLFAGWYTCFVLKLITHGSLVSELKMNASDEDYLVSMARSSLEKDPFESKAWMLTAKTLFQNKFGVQVKLIAINI